MFKIYRGRRGRDRMLVGYLITYAISSITTIVVSSNPAQARCTRYNIMWHCLSVICDRSVVFIEYSGFLHQYNWPPRYSWNFVESGVKHHNVVSNTTRHDQDPGIVYGLLCCIDGHHTCYLINSFSRYISEKVSDCCVTTTNAYYKNNLITSMRWLCNLCCTWQIHWVGCL